MTRDYRTKYYALRESRKQKGLCIACEKPQAPTSKWYCADCLHSMNMRVQKHQWKKLEVLEGGK